MNRKWIIVMCMTILLTSSLGCTRKNVTSQLQLQSLSSVAKENNMQITKDPNTQAYLLGDTDPLFILVPGQVNVKSGENTILLPDPPKMLRGDLYLSEQSVNKLFSESSTINQSDVSSQQPIHNYANPATKVNIQNLISFGRQFIGTPYRFAAGPYDRTHTFDCSSFVQYVFAHSGIHLPRASKDQAKVGQLVARANLQAGDIIAFYTPGRYASNRVVGHIGIYIGNNQVLHTYGSPGVTITDITQPNWSRRFLWARRET